MSVQRVLLHMLDVVDLKLFNQDEFSKLIFELDDLACHFEDSMTWISYHFLNRTLVDDLIDDSDDQAVVDNGINIYDGASSRIQFINYIILLCHEIKTTPNNDQLRVENFQAKLLKKIRHIEKIQVREDDNFESDDSSGSCYPNHHVNMLISESDNMKNKT